MVAKTVSLPNIRKMFIPDRDHYIVEADLDRADLQVVVWEADDQELKQMLHEGVNIHEENAKVIGFDKDMAKRFIHGTNYYGSARTMGISCGISIQRADRAQRRWFSAHPGISDWHRRTERQLAESRSVRNKFGYWRHYFDRIEGLLPKALAWIPQSTVALVIDHGLVNVAENLPEVEILLQVHDSLLLQFHKSLFPAIMPKIQKELLITVPYPDPLVISVGAKISDKSWGDATAVDWQRGKPL